MPITKHQFQLGIDAEIERDMRKLARFLEDHGDQAYSLSELWHETGQPGELVMAPWNTEAPVEQRRFWYAINKLVDLRVADERTLAGTNYYAIGKVGIEQVLAG